MKTKRQKITSLIQDVLKAITVGETMSFGETEVFKASDVNRFLKRKHEKGQFLEYKCVTGKIFDPKENTEITVMQITRNPCVNFSLSYII